MDRPCPNDIKNMFSSSDRQTEIIKRVQREYLNLRKRLVISFNWGKINTIVPE